jgi:diguanylate cyclase (GGDEF)-like protein
MEEKEKYNKGISLLIVDCDYFKRINDLYGHPSGDAVLSAIGKALNQSIEKKDYAFRWGGEEFCVILTDTSPFQAYVAAEKIRKGIEGISFTFNDEAVAVTASIGINHTLYNDDKTGIELVNGADIALYEAKHNGRNQTVVYRPPSTPAKDA